ncbi:MAG TPA: M20/M25/M40 family metallo-hydrolase [Dinghuibacter sp.]|uniref:M20/M25/M40 family metallo-hydrolase n=1 Tax=Dinghuibacter sp. TaxID=2024697 RepID=UPI002BB322A0|nr:M20/M25/M40 family metallo-hydrolase [Dinghuibacter sp.]HTJ11772.1 M20/M25/M40 family metallo-hydrolase [Dinghuibacter sp.]
MKKLLLSLLALSPLALFAQEPVDTTAFRMIRDAEMTDSHIPDIAYHITDASGSRLTNSPGYFRAANWAVAEMKGWGMQHTALEPWGEYGRGWEIEDFHIGMKAPYAGYILGYPLPWSNNTNGEIHAPVFLMTQSQLMDSAWLIQHAADMKGKIVLIAAPNDKHAFDDTKPYATRYTDSELVKLPDDYMLTRDMLLGYLKPVAQQERNRLRLKANGALAVIYAGGNKQDGTVGVQSFRNYKVGTPLFLPEANISTEDGFKLKRLINEGKTVELTLDIQARFNSDDTRGYNVVGEIPGTDPSLKAQLVMLGGHLDSWSAATGATDNGAGSIVMLEAVRLLDSLHLRPKRTIRIALWGGEEQGLLGSYHYVLNHFGNAETSQFKPERDLVSAYFNLDNGTGRIRGIYAQNNKAIQPIFQAWLAPFADLDASTVTLSNTGSTDHLSFDWVGIPGFQFIQDPLDYETKTHHTNMDTYDYLRIDDLKQAAVIVASFIYQASVRPDMLPRKPVVKETFVFDGF